MRLSHVSLSLLAVLVSASSASANLVPSVCEKLGARTVKLETVFRQKEAYITLVVNPDKVVKNKAGEVSYKAAVKVVSMVSKRTGKSLLNEAQPIVAFVSHNPTLYGTNEFFAREGKCYFRAYVRSSTVFDEQLKDLRKKANDAWIDYQQRGVRDEKNTPEHPEMSAEYRSTLLNNVVFRVDDKSAPSKKK